MLAPTLIFCGLPYIYKGVTEKLNVTQRVMDQVMFRALQVTMVVGVRNQATIQGKNQVMDQVVVRVMNRVMGVMVVMGMMVRVRDQVARMNQVMDQAMDQVYNASS
jgi:hypothetical protein